MQGAPFELRRGRELRGRSAGDWGEDLASRFLEDLGHTVIERNYRSRYGEIDLISRAGDALVFVEVKLRRGRGFGDPLEAVTPRKQEAIRSMAEQYLAEREPEYEELRFDVIGILAAGGPPEISHVEGAF